MRGSRSLVSYLAAFALVLTLPILFAALAAAEWYAEQERSRLATMADSAVQGMEARLEHEISTHAATLQALIASNFVQMEDLARFESQVRELSQRTNTHFALFDPSGRQLVNTRVEPGIALPQAADGETVPEVLRTKKLHVSNLAQGTVSGQHQIHVAVPAMRGGEVIAILVSNLSTEHLAAILRDSLPRGPFYALILDRGGTVVAQTDEPQENIGKRFSNFTEAGLSPKGRVSVPNLLGVPFFGSSRRQEISGWLVAAGVRQAALNAPFTRFLQFMALAVALLMGLAFGGVRWFGNKLTRSHSTLVSAVQALGEGREIAPSTAVIQETKLIGDALATASRSLAGQTEKLKRAKEELEQRVEARTNELADKSALLETTLNTIEQGLILIDTEGGVPICNTPARRMLDISGHAEDDGTIKGFRIKAGRNENLSRAQSRLLRVTPDDVGAAFEVERRSGRILQAHTVSLPGGGYLRTLTDVTEQRLYERDLKDMKEAAENASRAKTEFLATMSHEMRTLLNAVIGYSELLVGQAGLSGGARRSAERIHSAGAALLCLVDDILDLGKIEAGVIDVRNEPFFLPKLVDETLSFMRAQARDKGLELSLILEGNTSTAFLGDQDRLRQILLNLLNNAVKFTAAGRVQLMVSARPDEGERTKLRFAVSDTGIGIAKSDQESLFQRFRQVSPVMDNRLAGAGLGLAIVKQLVERMSGSYGVESELGKGATFWFELSLLPAPPGLAQEELVMRRQGARILIAEDVVINQELARELIQAAGHSVEVVSNGRQAVEAVKNRVYDLILMDVTMPEMDGLTATRLIRAAGYPAQATPIVACTANIVPVQVQAFREAGVDAYLRKPLRRAELLATIDRVLNRPLDRVQARPAAIQSMPPPDDFWNIVTLLGPKRVIAALDKLPEELGTLTISNPADLRERGELAKRAHDVITTASMLEMPELAESCRDVENACRDAADLRPALERLEAAVAKALAHGARLRTDLERHTL